MPPKKKNDGGGKKAEKKVEKIVEDKTFGLKNKNKSKTVQKYIKGVENVARQKAGLGAEDKSAKYHEKKEKKKQKQEEAFLNSLYKQITAVKTQTVPEGVDSKTVLCENFKAGLCKLGDKCPFSHDLNIEFNQGTFDIYTDLTNIKKNTFENEINKIAEEKEKKRKTAPKSNIVCKYFLDAVKKKVYGWKWECPNGDSCHYKHYLPKGYIIATDKDKAQEDMTIEEFMDLEEQIDAERERIAVNGTKVTEETFREWKKKRDEWRAGAKEEKEKNEMKSKFTGVQLFKKQADLFKDDENAAEKEDIKQDEGEVENDNNDNINNGVIKEEPKTEDEILKEIDNEMKEIKINEELFKGDENLDELDKIIDEEEQKEENKKDEEEDEKEENDKNEDEEDKKEENNKIEEEKDEDDKEDENEDNKE